MSSVNNNFINTQYKEIKKGLKQGNRVGRLGNSFLSVKKGDTKSQTLEQLNTNIKSFVTQNFETLGGIKAGKIANELNKRANSLEKRGNSFFIGKNTKLIIAEKVKQMRALASDIAKIKANSSSTVEEIAINTDEVASNIIPKEKEEKAPAKGFNLLRFCSGNEFEEAEAEHNQKINSSVQATDFMPPPPPPPPAFDTVSATHRAITDDADKLPMLSGEPKRPEAIDKKHDFGKIGETIKDPKQKSDYANKINTYVEQMKACIKKLHPEIERHKKLSADNTEYSADVKSYNEQIQSNEELISRLSNALQNGQSETLFFREGNTVIPVVFMPQSVLQKENQNIAKEDREFLEKSGLDINLIPTIEWKIENLKNVNNKLNQELITVNQSIEKNKQEMESIEKVESKVAFAELKGLIDKKETIIQRWETVFKNLSSTVKAKAKTEMAQANHASAVEITAKKYSHVNTFHVMLEAIKKAPIAIQTLFSGNRENFLSRAK